MKYFILCLCTLLMGILVNAQKFNVQVVEFGLYDLEGNRIGTGKIKSVTDQSLLFKPYYCKPKEVDIREIGQIRANSTKGTALLIGAVTGAGLGALIAAGQSTSTSFHSSSSEGNSSGAQSALLGALIGGIIGTSFGLLIEGSNHHRYRIRGKLAKWKKFRTRLTGWEYENDTAQDKKRREITAQDPARTVCPVIPARMAHRKSIRAETGGTADLACMIK